MINPIQPDDAPLYRTEVRFNSVYVIESLRDGEQKTGQDLYDQVIFPATSELDGFQSQYFRVRSSSEIAQSLATIARAVHHQGRRPIVHFEAHGSDDGIELTDSSLISWNELVPLLGDINRACRMNLFVIAASCQGWNLTNAIAPQDRSPLFMLIGPPLDMRGDALLEAMRHFYRVLLGSFDVNSALEAMNSDLPFENWSIKPATAEILFCRILRAYIDEGGTFALSRDEENDLVARAVRERGLDVTQSARARDDIRRMYHDQRFWYDHLRRHFLWIDAFPEHKWRFGLTYDLCFRNRSDAPAANA